LKKVYKTAIAPLYILTLSILDAFATAYGHKLGILTEANPLMEQLLVYDSRHFIIIKMILTTLSCYILFVLRDKFAAKAGLAICSFAYTAIIAIHMYNYIEFIRHASIPHEDSVVHYDISAGEIKPSKRMLK